MMKFYFFEFQPLTATGRRDRGPPVAGRRGLKSIGDGVFAPPEDARERFREEHGDESSFELLDMHRESVGLSTNACRSRPHLRQRTQIKEKQRMVFALLKISGSRIRDHSYAYSSTLIA